MKKYFTLTLVSIAAGFLGSYLFQLANQPMNSTPEFTTISVNSEMPLAQTIGNNPPYSKLISEDNDFVNASRTSTQSVVYIKNISELPVMDTLYRIIT